MSCRMFGSVAFSGYAGVLLVEPKGIEPLAS